MSRVGAFDIQRLHVECLALICCLLLCHWFLFVEQVLANSSVYMGIGWFSFAICCDATDVFLELVLAKSSAVCSDATCHCLCHEWVLAKAYH